MRVLILASNTRSLTAFRGDLIKEMTGRGHEVHTCGPEPDQDGAVRALGAYFYHLPMNRAGTNPLADMRLMKMYEGIIRQVKPDLLFCAMAKPNVYGGPAGKKAGVGRVVLMVEGLGNLFVPDGSIKRGLLRKVLVGLYRRAGKKCDRMIFLNPDDREDFIGMNIVPQAKTALINGIGVNMGHYTPEPPPKKPAFLMVSRLLREKGVMVYLEAAAMLKRDCPHARIMLVGPYENNRFSITEDDLRPYIESGTVEYFGEQKDVRPFYAQASAFVLPTSYREGLPRVILEAMACQRAVITTDMPGCRGTVIPDETGLIIPPRDAAALAQAMKRLAENPDDARRMGMKGYARCAEKYEVSKVNAQMVELLGL